MKTGRPLKQKEILEKQQRDREKFPVAEPEGLPPGLKKVLSPLRLKIEQRSFSPLHEW